MGVDLLDDTEVLSAFTQKFSFRFPTPFGKPKFHGVKKEGSIEDIRRLDFLLRDIRAKIITVLPRPNGDPAEVFALM